MTTNGVDLITTRVSTFNTYVSSIPTQAAQLNISDQLPTFLNEFITDVDSVTTTLSVKTK